MNKIILSIWKHIKNQCYNFKCPMTHCVFKSSSRLSLQHHETKCFKEENNFGCSKCDFKADQKNKENQRVGLIKHKRLGCFALTCTKCEFKTSNTKDFQTHKEGHRVTSYACNKCDYTAKAKTEREHRVLMERHVTLGCFRFWKTETTWLIWFHLVPCLMFKMIPSHSRFECLSCDFKTSIPNSMSVHRAQAHGRRTDAKFYKLFKESLSEVFKQDQGV